MDKPSPDTNHLETAFDKRIPILSSVRSARTSYFCVLGGCQSLINAILSALTGSKGQVMTGVTIQKIAI